MKRRDAILRISQDQVEAEVRERGIATWRATATFAGPVDLTEVIATLIAADALPPGSRLTVHLLPPLLQVRRLETLPKVRTADLGAILGTHPARYFRKNVKPLLTGGIWVDRKRTVATAVAVEEPYAQAIVDGVHQAGLVLVDIVTSPEVAPRISLLPRAERERRRRSMDHWLRWTGSAAAATWVGAALFVGGRAWKQSRRVDHELEELRVPVEAVLAAERQVAEAAAGVAAVDTDIHLRLGIVQSLSQVVAVLPDSAWLGGVVLRQNGEGDLTGWAPRPTEVLARVERVNGVLAPKLEGHGPAEIVAGRRVERFVIHFGPPEAQ